MAVCDGRPLDLPRLPYRTGAALPQRCAAWLRTPTTPRSKRQPRRTSSSTAKSRVKRADVRKQAQAGERQAQGRALPRGRLMLSQVNILVIDEAATAALAPIAEPAPPQASPDCATRAGVTAPADIDRMAEAIRTVVWLPGCTRDEAGTWSTISDDAKTIWRAAAHAAVAAVASPPPAPDVDPGEFAPRPPGFGKQTISEVIADYRSELVANGCARGLAESVLERFGARLQAEWRAGEPCRVSRS